MRSGIAVMSSLSCAFSRRTGLNSPGPRVGSARCRRYWPAASN
jgi:hypothetical protein